jgi:TolA-binding protein
MEPEQPDVRTRRGLRIAALVVGSLALAALIAAGGVAAYLARSNADRARRWETRSLLAEHNAHELNGLLVERTADLNVRIRQLNQMAGKVESSQSALSRSESDVTSLVERQRELANEKAQLEDQQAALADVATAYRQCKDGLATAIDHILANDLAWVQKHADSIDSVCGNADDSFAGYQQAFGGG